MSKQPVNIGLIGAGWWGTTAHLPAIQQHPGAKTLAVQCRTAEKAQAVAADFDVPHACVTAEELLALPGLDGVIIATTPNAHYEQAKAALQRGIHVLVEKPMTITAAESEELLALAAEKNVHFLVSCPWHYTSHGIETRRLLSENAIGPIRMISVLMTNYVEGLYEGKSWTEIFGDNSTRENAAMPYRTPNQNSYSDPKIAGGGQIYCQVSHAAAYLSFLTGAEPTEVFSRFLPEGADIDIYNALNLKLSDGTVVNLSSHGVSPPNSRTYEVRIFGDSGAIHLDLWKGLMEVHRYPDGPISLPPLKEEEIYLLHAPAKNLVDCILGDATNGSPASTGVFAMKVIEAAVRSARTGENVKLN